MLQHLSMIVLQAWGREFFPVCVIFQLVSCIIVIWMRPFFPHSTENNYWRLDSWVRSGNDDICDVLNQKWHLPMWLKSIWGPKNCSQWAPKLMSWELEVTCINLWFYLNFSFPSHVLIIFLFFTYFLLLFSRTFHFIIVSCLHLNKPVASRHNCCLLLKTEVELTVDSFINLFWHQYLFFGALFLEIWVGVCIFLTYTVWL